ncbi:MAG: hypothetical protein LC128_01425 [Chitinophagales bacterium]|nr:hypothetical protein [Chitinophagales bacterium]
MDKNIFIPVKKRLKKSFYDPANESAGYWFANTKKFVDPVGIEPTTP